MLISPKEIVSCNSYSLIDNTSKNRDFFQEPGNVLKHDERK